MQQSLARTSSMSSKKAPGRTSAARKKKFQLNLRISDLARDLLERIGDKHGMNLTHALEYAIRQTARAEHVWDIGDKS